MMPGRAGWCPAMTEMAQSFTVGALAEATAMFLGFVIFLSAGSRLLSAPSFPGADGDGGSV